MSQTTGSLGVEPNLSGQAVCASLHPQEAMQMVPKFCFPFDVERYGRKQTPKDPGTQTSHGPPGFQHPETQTTEVIYPGPLRFRDPGTQKPGDPDK